MMIIPLLIYCVLASPAISQQPYRLQPGDELDVRVVGIPNLDRRLFIEDTGKVSLPLIGRLTVAGRTLAEAQAAIAQALSNKVFRQRGISGEIDLFSIDEQEVSVVIASFLPVYVDGSVNRPGAVAFTPGLTARRAIALAGGVGGALSEDHDTTPQLLQARTRYRSIRAQLAALDIRLARFRAQAELGDIPEGGSAGLGAVERTLTEAMRENLDRERQFLEKARAAILNEIDLLKNQLNSYSELVAIDETELQRQLDLGERGLGRANQTVAARRSLSSSRTDRLETMSNLADRQRDLVRVEFELESLSATVISDGLEALSDGLARREQLQGERDGLQEQILYLGGGVGQGALARVEVSRGEERLAIPQGGDLKLHPGDLVDVAIDLFDIN